MAKLYRSMKEDADGLPVVARSARALGVRTPADVPRGVQPDVTAVDSSDIIQHGSGGVSTAPDDPRNLIYLRRPRVLGGKSDDPAWEIDTAHIGPDLVARQDKPGHVLIEPVRAMTLAEYEAALAATRPYWVRHTG
jgi:hypothetical protein